MKKFLKTKLPVIVVALLLIPIYSLPIWWVSLTAPNYPEEAFPDGVKINFHMNGVFNGCKAVEKTEIFEDVTLDCVHEMDTINHYVGMYPIAAGGPVEVAYSIFLMCMVGVMLLTYIIDDPNRRMVAQIVGFSLIIVWMALVMYAPNGLKYYNEKYLEGRVAALGHDIDDASDEMSAAESMIASLKASLAASGVDIEEEEVKTQKERDIIFLKDSFNANQSKLAINEEWKGNGIQLLSWHYRTNLARYFNNPDEVGPLVNIMTTAAHVVFFGVIAIMIALVIGCRKTYGIFHKMLILVPMALPAIFIAFYAGWLNWYGHNMNEMGAFTLKPFMPTVFGQGKVAQFTTNSYPHIGFFLMLIVSALLIYTFMQDRNKQADSKRDNEK